ncbi:MAG TPA: hypothetical protein DCY79_05365 [Planctomycetaceae bacterium]|nr:hypothetical protein [Blastopirellula sp.]HAY79218.1 hypothetical protein [Planctomycetaceae bacterium]
MPRLTSLLAQSQTNDTSNGLTLIFFAIGGALIAYGAWGLKAGKTRGKYGTQFDGNAAMILSGIRLLGGLICCGFALYQLLIG